LYAAIGAAGAGLLGTAALRLLRHRSVPLSLAVVAAVTVAAMLAGTILAARAMFLSDHDLWVVTMVCSMAAVVSLVVALLLGRSVDKGSRALAKATRAPGDDGSFTPPTTASTVGRAVLSRELAATSAKLEASRERERALEAFPPRTGRLDLP
jgi:hypothetical protein